MGSSSAGREAPGTQNTQRAVGLWTLLPVTWGTACCWTCQVFCDIETASQRAAHAALGLLVLRLGCVCCSRCTTALLMSSLVQRVEQHRPVPCRSVSCAALQPHSLHCCPQFVQGCSAQGPPWEQWQDTGLQAVQAAEKPLRGSGCGAGLAVGWIWLWGTGPGAGHAARCHQGGMGWLHALTAACCVPGETFVLGDGPPGPLEPRMDPMDSALNAVNASGHSRSSREFRLQGYRHLHQPCSLSQGSTSALGRLGSTGRSMWEH